MKTLSSAPLLASNWYFVTKIVLIFCEKNCSSDREKLLKFEAEGRELAKFLRSVEKIVIVIELLFKQ